MSQLKNDLTPIALNPTLAFHWYDTEVTVPDSSLNERIFITTSTGPLSLTYVSGTLFKASQYIDVLNTAYNDSEDIDADRFYTSYLNNYQAHTLTDETLDLSVNIVAATGNNSLVSIPVDVYNNNDLVFDLQAFVDLSNNTNPSSSYDINLDTDLTYLTVANTTSNTSTITINFSYFPYVRGIEAPTVPTLYVGDTGVSMDLSINALTAGAYVNFTTDFDSNQSYLATFPYPSVYFANMIANITDLSFGTQSVNTPITIPSTDIIDTVTLKSGSWNLNMTLYDGAFTQVTQIRLIVMPEFTTPVITFTNSPYTINSNTHETATVFNVNYDYAAADKANFDVTTWARYIEFTAAIIDVSGNDIGASNDFLTLDKSVNNLPTIVETGDTSANFNVTYNGEAWNVLTDDDYYIKLSYKPVDAVTWTDVSENISVSRSYTAPLVIDNNYDGTFTAVTPIVTGSSLVFGSNVIEIHDLSDSSVTDLCMNTLTFSGTEDHEYQLRVVDTGNNIYTETVSAAFTSRYSTQLDISNNYDGTFSVLNVPTLYNSDRIAIDQTGESLVDLCMNTLTFTGVMDASYNVSIYTTDDTEYTNITSATTVSRYSTQLDISNNYDGTFSVLNLPTLYNGDVVRVDNGTVLTDLVGSTFTGCMDVTYNVSIYSTAGNEYTNLTSSDVVSRYETQLDISNNYDGTFTVLNAPGILYSGDLVKVEHEGTGFVDLCLNNMTFTGVMDASFNVSVYSTAGNEYTNLTSATTVSRYETQLDISNNYDGTFSVLNLPTLYNGDVVRVDNGTVLTDLSGSTFTGSMDVTYNVSIYSTAGNEYTNLTSSDVVSRYNGQTVSISDNHDGTFTITGPTLHGSDAIKVNSFNGLTTVVSGSLFTPSGSEIGNTFTASVYDDTTEYTNLRTSSYIEYYNSVVTYTNNFNGTYEIDSYSLASGHTIYVTDGTTPVNLGWAPNTFTVLANTSYTFYVVDNSSNKKTHTVSSTLVVNANVDLVMGLAYNGSSNLQSLANDGYGYDGVTNFTIANESTIYGSDSDTITANVTFDTPAWITNTTDYKFIVIVTENTVDTEHQVVSTVDLSNNDSSFSGSGVRSSNVFTQTSIDANALTTDININLLTGRVYASNLTVFVKVVEIDTSTVLCAAYSQFYVRPDHSAFLGQHYNNLVVLNDMNMTFDVSGGNLYDVPSLYTELDGSTKLTNIWTNLAAGANSNKLWNVGLARSNFMGLTLNTLHTLTAGSVTMELCGNHLDSSENLPVLNADSIDINYFTGTILLSYNDTYRSVVSENPNILKLIVLPRTSVTHQLSDLSSNLLSVNRQGYLTQGVINKQITSGLGATVGFTNSGITTLKLDGTDGLSLTNMLAAYVTCTWKTRTVSPDNSLFTIHLSGSNSLADSVSTTLTYNQTKYGIINYAGKDIDGTTVDTSHSIVYTSTINYTRPTKDAVGTQTASTLTLTSTDSITVNFFDDDDYTYTPEVNATNLNVESQITLDNLVFAEYVKVTDNIDLATNYSNRIYVIVENIYLADITVSGVVGGDVNVPYATRGIFARKTSTTWELLYMETA